jgi:hypothetical protein
MTDIERLARAAAKLDVFGDGPQVEELLQAHAEQYKPIVLAILDALAEPSEGMQWEGSIAIQEYSNGKYGGVNDASRACWQRMISHIRNGGA